MFALGCATLIKLLERAGNSPVLDSLTEEQKQELKSELVGFTSQKARVCICMLHVCIHHSSCAGLFDTWRVLCTCAHCLAYFDSFHFDPRAFYGPPILLHSYS